MIKLFGMKNLSTKSEIIFGITLSQGKKTKITSHATNPLHADRVSAAGWNWGETGVIRSLYHVLINSELSFYGGVGAVPPSPPKKILRDRSNLKKILQHFSFFLRLRKIRTNRILL